jgi:hypothetical protein
MKLHGARPELIDACTPELYLAGGRLDKETGASRRLPFAGIAAMTQALSPNAPLIGQAGSRYRLDTPALLRFENFFRA